MWKENDRNLNLCFHLMRLALFPTFQYKVRLLIPAATKMFIQMMLP